MDKKNRLNTKNFETVFYLKNFQIVLYEIQYDFIVL